MKPFTLILGLILMGASLQTAQATGNEVGNGGTARVCESKVDSSKSIEPIDYWEGQIITKHHLDLGPGAFEQKIQYVLDRLAKFDPYRAERLRNKAQKIISNLEEYLTDVPLQPTPDGNAIYNPAYEDDKMKCYEVQFAIRLKKIRGDLKRFLFVRDAWNIGGGEALEIARAGMILHEINGDDAVLRENDPYRDNTRFFTFEISSDAFNQFAIQNYLQLLQDTDKISRTSTVFIKGNHYFSQDLKLDAFYTNSITKGIEIPDHYAKIMNLDFEKTGDSPILASDQQLLEWGQISLTLPIGTSLTGFNNNEPFSFSSVKPYSNPLVLSSNPNFSIVFRSPK
ncbi:MAG: hypothetical protein HYY62_00370, partial [Deltaproteobacteria bacterium]|nr:hypothetical protein [Deltaproteobacteria bacterium]